MSIKWRAQIVDCSTLKRLFSKGRNQNQELTSGSNLVKNESSGKMYEF